MSAAASQLAIAVFTHRIGKNIQACAWMFKTASTRSGRPEEPGRRKKCRIELIYINSRGKQRGDDLSLQTECPTTSTIRHASGMRKSGRYL